MGCEVLYFSIDEFLYFSCIFRIFIFYRLDLRKELGIVLIVEGRVATKQDVHDHARRPNINAGTVGLARQDPEAKVLVLVALVALVKLQYRVVMLVYNNFE